MPRIEPYNIHVPELNAWKKFDEIPDARWNESNPSDYVLVDIGLNNGRGVAGFVNKYLSKFMESGFSKFIAPVTKFASGLLPFPVQSFADIFGKKMSIETALNGSNVVKNVKIPFLTDQKAIDDIKTSVKNRIEPTFSNAVAFHYGMLIKRLCGSILDRFAVLRSGNFDSDDGRTIITSVLALQVLVLEDVLPNWYFISNGDKNIFYHENFKRFIYGLVDRKYKIDDIKELCNFLATFQHTTDQVKVDNFTAGLKNEQNNQSANTQKNANVIAAVGVGLTALLLFMRK